MPSVRILFPLYKYLEPQYAHAMFSDGIIRIGTLSEYRAMEGIDAERGDSTEGEVVLQSPPGRQEYGGSRIPPPLRDLGIYIGPGALLTMGNGAAITINQKIQDLFVYCTMGSCDPAYGYRLGKSCVVIHNPEQFFFAVDAALRSAMSGTGISLAGPFWGRCAYEGRTHNWEREDVPPAWLLKPAQFQGQQEIRIGWEPSPMQAFSPIDLKAPAAVQHCMLLSAP